MEEILDEVLQTPFMKTWIQSNFKKQLIAKKLVEEGLSEFISEKWEVLEQSPKFMSHLTDRIKTILTQEAATITPQQLPSMVETNLFYDEIRTQVNISGVFKYTLRGLLTALNTKTEEELRELVLKARRE
jgi:uncharacterized coiled-coil protein SlyX